MTNLRVRNPCALLTGRKMNKNMNMLVPKYANC